MKVEFTKEVSDFIMNHGTMIATKEGTFVNVSCWYKMTDDPLVFEQMSFGNLPETLISTIKELRDRKEPKGLFVETWPETITTCDPSVDKTEKGDGI